MKSLQGQKTPLIVNQLELKRQPRLP